ncbi:ABC transporter ATP-binding protein [Castellaniella sp.]|uniref:ABC transporter ATP-binding protein n=1 Tax=Castellaniella sp. TaxID=1955812 RepID=UPI002AFE0157|nr:ABC transporter ATP-binding protein [Castellaniella sp.]
MSALVLEGIVSGYHGRPVLHGVSLSVSVHGSLTVVGPNGSGKSTLMKTVVGLVRPEKGRVLLEGEDVTRLDAPARASRGLGHVPQEANVFRALSVAENLRVAFDFIPARSGATYASRLEAVLELFPEIRPKLKVAAGHLSGGQRQMVAMAAALMPEPSVLALDEPSAGLSPKNAELLFVAIRRIVEAGVTLLMIEQNTRLGLTVAAQGLVLVAGQVKAHAPARELLADGLMQSLYLGGH